MNPKAQNLLRKKLRRYSEEERDAIIGYLCVVGLKHYSLLYPGQDIEIPLLEYLCDKYVNDLAVQPAGGNVKIKAKADGACHASYGIANRQFRLDSLAHYPFQDDAGTVTEALHSPSTEVRKLMEMGAPARKRLVAKIFDEMRFSKVGLRMSDVPEALERLGLAVSPALRKILERTNPANLSMHQRRAHAEQAGHVAERHIDLSQFSAIVMRLLQLVRQGVNLRDVVNLFDSPQEFEDAAVGGSDWEGEGEAEVKRASAGERGAERDHDSSDDPFAQADSTLHAARSTRMAQRRAGAAAHNVDGSSGPHNSSKSATSKIASIVRYDKRRYKELAAKRDGAALKTVAQRRVDALTSTAVPLGFKDRHYFSEPKLFQSKVTARSGDLASAVLHKPAATVSNPDYRRYADLGTGMATMEIADAFLHGDVGREILSTTESDYRSFAGDDWSLDPASAQRTAEVLLGVPPHQQRHPARDGGKEEFFPARTFPPGHAGDARFAPNAQYHLGADHHRSTSVAATSHSQAGHPSGSRLRAASGPSSGSMSVADYTSAADQHRLSQAEYGHRTVAEKRVEQSLNESAKRMYEAPGWRSAQGGWAADFGPAHTHSLYTGPEVNYATIEERRSTGRVSTGAAEVEEAPRPWAKQHSARDSSAARSSGGGAAERSMAVALDAVSSANAELQLQHHRNDAAIDAMLMRAAGSPASAAALHHYESRSNRAMWEDENSSLDGSAVQGAGVGEATRNSQGVHTFRKSEEAVPTLQSSVHAGRDRDSQVMVPSHQQLRDSASTGSADDDNAGTGAHYNPYLDEEDEVSGDDAEFAASLDDSVSLNVAANL